MNLSDSLNIVPGIGPAIAKRLEKLNLFTIEDLVNHYPFRYDDFSNTAKIIEVKFGENVTLKGEIWSIKNAYTRFRKVITKAILNDGTAPIELVWFNQPYLIKSIKPGDKLYVAGRVDKFGSKLSVVAPDWEKAVEDKDSLHTGRLVPVYPETYGISSKWLRLKIANILPNILLKLEDPLPDFIKGDLIPFDHAISKIHFPKDYQEAIAAKRRLGFDELFFIQLATQKTRQEWQEKKVFKSLEVIEDKLEDFISSLPFELTGAQKRVIWEIIDDLRQPFPMNRLLQGEVGSGKTVVATVIIYLNFLNGLKSLLMAPTEILAFQHYSTISKLLEPYRVKVGIYTGSKKQVEEAQVIVGTHALLSKNFLTEQVGLVVIDEQQRFGVVQRTLLRSKVNLPHFLAMTATPIPRTVSLTLYGDLDLSIIDEMPKGRVKVKTYVVPDNKRQAAYGFIANKIKQGDQVYIITPLIEESETLVSAKAAKVEFELLQKVFPDFKLGLLHGRLKSKEKEEVINKFKDRQINILVSTSVVEVGVDVPNATIMLVEGSERFGLAQLHQLRGRVGRGEKESFCFLFSSEDEPSAMYRLKNLEKTNNGLELAEMDLKIRGSGDIFGVRQSGRWDLKIANFNNLDLIEKSREKAREILKIDPGLDKYPLLKAELARHLYDVMPD